jgi:hypothetical protein
VTGSIIISSPAISDTKLTTYQESTTTSRIQIRELELLAVVVAEHPLVTLKFLDEDGNGSKEAANPQQGLC